MHDEAKQRCVNIDWLEVYVLESAQRYPCNAEYFRRQGYYVRERAYGTRVYKEMFEILNDQNQPVMEIRRNPASGDAEFNGLVPESCHIRLPNWILYQNNPVDFLCQFLLQHDYIFKRIFRIDICYDFTRFDTGDKPVNVVRRIVNHTYSKINQSHRRTSGTDTWTECFDNWISWGNPKSMVNTKIYDKTKELHDTGNHKPWIPELWRKAGYIDDIVNISKDGRSIQMWRLEFSIKGNAKEWIYIGKNDCDDEFTHTLPHSLEVYSTRQGIINAIANLVPYYFRFKIYVEGRRKSNCDDKTLFIFDDAECETGYRLLNQSDAGRIKPKHIENEVAALNHLIKASMKLYGTEYEQALRDVISKLSLSIDRKSLSIYEDIPDIF